MPQLGFIFETNLIAAPDHVNDVSFELVNLAIRPAARHHVMQRRPSRLPNLRQLTDIDEFLKNFDEFGIRNFYICQLETLGDLLFRSTSITVLASCMDADGSTGPVGPFSRPGRA
jgi:hypothetical protein